ncbi:prepilin-type N-terminal cleavage/methylation domain-containing protein [Piscinibacter sakaiensis]|uniref:Prepilin-type N-terminal cleavage/methylation domain-containing protein n=1 Tax=Piscinibacter sakaiensis TaxID=1547922 RepID=A0A0K8NU28_PISS1|nr:prepilin-type N-terminal cleavage/methylation domain-containing protein [Piscinibacter sakaiensis]GAP33868.1 hypothetical protein ISF6_1123 [Piscinibacter sakaiensis]
MGRRTADPQPRGFTLIEMMVVLVLLGLVTTLALPAVQRWHDGLQLRAQGMGIVEALRAAAFAAGASRRDLVMDRDSFSAAATAAPMPAASGPAPVEASAEGAGAGSNGPADGVPAVPPAPPVPREGRASAPLPAGWRVERVERAVFLANGLCRPGRAALRSPAGVALTVRVDGPACAVTLVPTDAGAESGA